jgi:Flp pilus assembly pilin Flp
MLIYYGERGQGLAEYAFLIALIALIVIVALVLLSGGIESLYNNAIQPLLDLF